MRPLQRIRKEAYYVENLVTNFSLFTFLPVSSLTLQSTFVSVVFRCRRVTSPPQQKTPKTSARTSTANLLTSSPFKKRVAEKRAQKEKKQATKGTRTKRKGSCVAGPSGVAGVSSPKVSKSTTEPDSDDEELPCIVWRAVFTFNPYLEISLNELEISLIQLEISLIHLEISLIELEISLIRLFRDISK